MLEAANLLAVGILGLYKLRGQPRLFVALASLTASAAILMLGRVEDQALTVAVKGIKFSWLQLTPFFYTLVPVIASGRIRRSTVLLFGLAILITLYGLVTWLVGAGDQVGILFATTAFAGPMLTAVFVGFLDEDGAAFVVERIRMLIGLAAIAAIASGVAGQWFSNVLGWERAPMRGLSPLGGPIATGAVVLLVWPEIYCNALQKRSLAAVGLAVVCLIAFLLMGSRMNMLAAILGVIVVTLRFVLSRPVTGIVRMFVSVAVAAGVGMLLAELPSVSRLITVPGTSSSDVKRLQSLETGLKLVAERPFVGWGPGQVYPWYRFDLSGPGGNLTEVRGMPTLVEPHNMYVMVAVEYGVPILIVFSLVLLWTVVSLALAGQRAQKAQLFYVAVGIVEFMVAAVGSSHLLVNPRVATAFWLYVGSNLVMLGNAGQDSASSSHGTKRTIVSHGGVVK